MRMLLLFFFVVVTAPINSLATLHTSAPPPSPLPVRETVWKKMVPVNGHTHTHTHHSSDLVVVVAVDVW